MNMLKVVTKFLAALNQHDELVWFCQVTWNITVRLLCRVHWKEARVRWTKEQKQASIINLTEIICLECTIHEARSPIWCTGLSSLPPYPTKDCWAIQVLQQTLLANMGDDQIYHARLVYLHLKKASVSHLVSYCMYSCLPMTSINCFYQAVTL